ncbi:alpha/beta hydrolase-fold protein [Sphingorhabdus sp. EL138]|uniref:alpha/beta hydrolase-fold protein n=1 Tax=Sphingorhabdus sp. EL138 TaxID=2073156 RepID=UPI001C1FBCAF|nr:alpha/beta hydrolase-fold protein [Sphingorhabdus sp. EL138]
MMGDVMRFKKCFLGIFLLLFPFATAQANEQKPYDMPRTQVVPIHDSGADRQYELYIKLPEDYAKNTDTKYPVIYATDAVWHMEMLSGATEYLMPEVILVGISWQQNLGGETAHESRFRDYSIVKSRNSELQDKYQFGQAARHLSFIRDDVIQYVESSYRTKPGERTYFGYSLGGVFGAYILLAKPGSFDNYIIGSPALNSAAMARLEMLETELNSIQYPPNTGVFLSIGELEKDKMDRTKSLGSAFRQKGNSGLNFAGLTIIDDSNHGSAFPETVIRGIRWLSERSSDPGRYLGQKPPGLTPEVFAPGIVSTKGWEVGGVFTPDMNEFYYIRENGLSGAQEFVVFTNENNRWQEAVISPRVGQPFISPDGKVMHLGKRYKERTKTGWSELKSLGSPFEEIRIMRLTTSSKGTYVFDEATRDGNGVLRYSRKLDGKREDPKPLPKEINTGRWNAHPFIAPDESYIIWDGQRDSPVRNADLFISFRKPDGSWGEAIKMGDTINTVAGEFGARVTPDGKYLFFQRDITSDKYRNVDIFWVNASVIEDLKPK